MNKDEVIKLANLARVEISNDEADKLSLEFGAILDYVGEIKKAGLSNKEYGVKNDGVINVVREDVGAHESGIHTEDLLNEAPEREGSYLKVKKIL